MYCERTPWPHILVYLPTTSDVLNWKSPLHYEPLWRESTVHLWVLKLGQLRAVFCLQKTLQKLKPLKLSKARKWLNATFWQRNGVNNLLGMSYQIKCFHFGNWYLGSMFKVMFYIHNLKYYWPVSNRTDILFNLSACKIYLLIAILRTWLGMLHIRNKLYVSVFIDLKLASILNSLIWCHQRVILFWRINLWIYWCSMTSRRLMFSNSS